MKIQIDLSKFNNDWYYPGASRIKIILWFFVNALLINSYLLPVSSLKVFILRLFGAKIGSGCVLKPKINIKYPWKLQIGNNCWIGENVWIDNLEFVKLGESVCISQGAFVLCGNHDYTKASFDLIVNEIKIDDGAWIGAKAVVCPGVHIANHSILSVGSILTKNTEPYCIYQGNPAHKKKERIIHE